MEREKTLCIIQNMQMSGNVKRCLGLNINFKFENPPGHRIQRLFIGNEEVNPEKYCSAALVTSQGVPQKPGRNRENQSC